MLTERPAVMNYTEMESKACRVAVAAWDTG